jgi:uncharacterized protein YuzE
MKLSYFPETDTLYITLVDQASVESDEIANDVIVDFDANARIVGIEIEHASQTLDLTKLEAKSLPIAG